MAKLAITNDELQTRFADRKSPRQALNQFALGSMSATGIGICLAILAVLLTIVVKGAPALSWEFLTARPDDGMRAGGISPMIRGTIYLMLGTFAFVLPIGVLAGVFLAEYAGRGKAVQVVRSLITSLAGTPSIIFGLFGLAVFVLWFKELGITEGTSLLAGWLTLAMMALPVITLSTESAMQRVPSALIDGGLAIGLTKWQVIWKIALPHALPGIMTGIVITVGRVAGEAPPILLTAGIYYATQEAPLGLQTVKQPVMNLPYHLAEGYRQGSTIPEHLIWGTCLVLMILILLMTLGAIGVRSWARAHRSNTL